MVLHLRHQAQVLMLRCAMPAHTAHKEAAAALATADATRCSDLPRPPFDLRFFVDLPANAPCSAKRCPVFPTGTFARKMPPTMPICGSCSSEWESRLVAGPPQYVAILADSEVERLPSGLEGLEIRRAQNGALLAAQWVLRVSASTRCVGNHLSPSRVSVSVRVQATNP